MQPSRSLALRACSLICTALLLFSPYASILSSSGMSLSIRFARFPMSGSKGATFSPLLKALSVDRHEHQRESISISVARLLMSGSKGATLSPRFFLSNKHKFHLDVPFNQLGAICKPKKKQNIQKYEPLPTQDRPCLVFKRIPYMQNLEIIQTPRKITPYDQEETRHAKFHAKTYTRQDHMPCADKHQINTLKPLQTPRKDMPHAQEETIQAQSRATVDTKKVAQIGQRTRSGQRIHIQAILHVVRKYAQIPYHGI